MRLRRSGPLVLFTTIAITAVGCAKKQPPPPAPIAAPANAQTLSVIRNDIARLDPGARIGIVAQVLDTDRLAAVGDLDTREFKEGDAITFIDTNQEPLTNGRIILITPNQLHVKYDRPTGGGRPPREGDLAVRFSTP